MSKIDLIFYWNKNSIHNNHNTIQEVIKEWEQHYLCDFTTDSEEKAIINGLYDMYNMFIWIFNMMHHGGGTWENVQTRW